eukprot:SAG11_NODE_6440_length_1313_cov_1.361614_1_plen_125_part_00
MAEMQDEIVRTMVELNALRAELGISPDQPAVAATGHQAWQEQPGPAQVAAAADNKEMGSVVIKMLSGQHINVPVDLRGTVWSVKESIQLQTSWLVAQQRLIFGGRQLEDDFNLASCGVYSGSIL